MATAGFFDDVVMIHAPPEGAPPDDESIELVKAAGVRLVHTTINAGFGVVRTRCIRESKASWVMIMDCDERFHPVVPVLRCDGTEGYPQFKNPNLTITVLEENYDQGARLKHLIEHESANMDAVCLSRRHWFNEPGKFEKPCQSWSLIADWQLRCVRNTPFVFYSPEHRMHEKILDSRTWGEPRFIRCNQERGPFIDHFHMWAKSQEPAQNQEDLATYKMLDEAGTKDMWIRESEGNAGGGA